MSDEAENLVLVFLRRLDAKIDGLQADVRELKQRVTTVAHQIARVVATEASHYASLSSRLDRIEDRLAGWTSCRPCSGFIGMPGSELR